MDYNNIFKGVYKDRRVLITGHSGFKGSWLSFWLQKMGAHVLGFSNQYPTTPAHAELLKLTIHQEWGDIRNLDLLKNTIINFQPEIIFHLAAQPLVRYSYLNPVETFETNIMGTVYMFEVARSCKSVKAIVNITSDKAYENLETDIAYKETDRMGGYDPYSASKGCAELIVNSYRNSYFNLDQYESTHHILLSSARAGNVIGGGDWSADRLIPDIIIASEKKIPVKIRSPLATRPWQHVLEPLSGYLLLGQHLLNKEKDFASGWNFGPMKNEVLQVQQVLSLMKDVWNDLDFVIEQPESPLHEANLLKLDCEKANTFMKWNPVWSMNVAIEKTANWYKEYYNNGKILTESQLDFYIKEAREKKVIWTL